MSVPTPATLEGIAAGIDEILTSLGNQQTKQADSPSAIPNPISLTAAVALAQSKGWTLQPNLNATPATVSFFMNVGGMGNALVATVGLTLP